MTSPLNPALYQRLREEFGRVDISQAGIAAVKHYGRGAFLSQNVVRMELNSAGEYYRVSCPYCGDRRNRLWINHMWGVRDEVTNNNNLWLAICFNENCMALAGRPQNLYERIYGFKNANLRGKPVIVLQGVIEEVALKEVKPPGLILPLDKLPQNDRVLMYLRHRGLDYQTLQQQFNIGYCLNADSEYNPAQDRIYIPIHMHDTLVGWQCRYAEDLNWKEQRILKYYSRPGMPRRLMLYNYDNAIKFPFVVVNEGPTDVWNVGPYAVASFGKHLSAPQVKLLCDGWPNGVIFVLLDGDAKADTLELVDRLKNEKYKGSVIPVLLPEDKDPGSLDLSVNSDYIISAAEKAGIDILSLKREESNENSKPSKDAGLLVAVNRLKRQLKPVSDYSFDSPRNS